MKSFRSNSSGPKRQQENSHEKMNHRLSNEDKENILCDERMSSGNGVALRNLVEHDGIGVPNGECLRGSLRELRPRGMGRIICSSGLGPEGDVEGRLIRNIKLGGTIGFRTLDCRVGPVPSIYSRLPLGAHFKAKAVLDIVVEWFEKRPAEWKKKVSFQWSGKEIGQAAKRISLGSEEEKRIHLIGWDTVKASKMEGGWVSSR